MRIIYIKEIVSLLLTVLMLLSCSEGQIEELAFRKTLEYDLVKLCGKEDKECIKSIKTQTKSCMEKSNWRAYLEDQENEEELIRFSSKFYACVVDSKGNPYFEVNV